MKKEVFKIHGMHCPSCAVTIEKGISKIPGISSCQVHPPPLFIRVDIVNLTNKYGKPK